MIKLFIANTFVKWFKQIGIFGWVRFRILRLAYYIFWQNSPRIGEWSFILQYLQPLRDWQKPVWVLDVGATESLLVYELEHRGYNVTALDQRPYQERLPYPIMFWQADISSERMTEQTEFYDYIVAVSAIEHIGLGAYNDPKSEGGDYNAVKNIHRLLAKTGYFICTVPNKHLGTETGRGYSYQNFKKLIDGLFDIYELTERSGQLCVVLVKKP